MKQLEKIKNRLPPGTNVRISSKNVLSFRVRFHKNGYPDQIKTFPDEDASREHVQGGIKGGFAQICHGKIGTLKYMSEGDWLIYYSPAHSFGGKDTCRCFTAIGTIDQEEPYTFEISKDFIPWRRNVTFIKANEVSIEPLSLSGLE